MGMTLAGATCARMASRLRLNCVRLTSKKVGRRDSDMGGIVIELNQAGVTADYEGVL
jgi:hypothetical protein